MEDSPRPWNTPITPALRHHFADMEQQHEAASLGMWLFLATEIMFFGGMFCCYLIYRHLVLPRVRRRQPLARHHRSARSTPSCSSAAA